MQAMTRGLAVAGLALLIGACDLAYPEVAVRNETAEHYLVRNVSFNGCLWDAVLGYGEATSPGQCLPGADRVHFQRLDTRADGEPLWFAYQTVAEIEAEAGEFHLLEIRLGEIEQDFGVPGPYGH
jgi:hypothetical protein